MRSVLLLTTVIALGISLLAQTSAPISKGEKSKSATFCTVSGRVVTAAEGNPLKLAHVALAPEHQGRPSDIYAAISDGDGRFRVKEVPPGRYRFVATRAGYVDQQYQSKGAGKGAILALQPKQEVTDVLFRMVMAAVITGRVSDEDGEPMANIQVVALRAPDEEEIEDGGPFSLRKQELIPASSVQTDDRGQYRIFGLKPGDYYMRATDTFEPQSGMQLSGDFFIRQSLGSQYVPVYYPGVLQVNQAQLVSLRAGEEMQADFSMRHGRTVEISGRVIGPNGKPGSNIGVSLQELGVETYGMDHSADVDAEGKFRLKGVPPGSYMLVAYERVEDSRYSARQKIEVGNDNIESISLALGRGANFRGRVLVDGPGDLHLEDIWINLDSVSSDQQSGGFGRVKKDGSFELTDVAEGQYVLSIGTRDPGWYTKSARLGEQDVLAEGLQVEKGLSGGTFEIVIGSSNAQLEGSVTEDEKPVAGAHVRIDPYPATPYNTIRRNKATTDQTGRFLFSDIAPGKYRVSAKFVASGDAQALMSDSQTVTVSEHGHKTVQLTLVPPQSQ